MVSKHIYGINIAIHKIHDKITPPYLSPYQNIIIGGNPAAVCLLEKDIPDSTKQKIATEMNLSETAFVVPAKYLSALNIQDTAATQEGNIDGIDIFKTMSRFSLRWFTPTSEVPLCGHATLAAAVVLFYIKNNYQVYNYFVTYVQFSLELNYHITYTLLYDLRCIYFQFLHFETVYSGTLTARRCDVDESINPKGML